LFIFLFDLDFYQFEEDLCPEGSAYIIGYYTDYAKPKNIILSGKEKTPNKSSSKCPKRVRKHTGLQPLPNATTGF